MRNLARELLLWVVIVLVLLAVFSRYMPTVSQQEEIRYSTFLKDVQGGHVDSVILQGDTIYGVRKDKTQFKAYNPETDYTALLGSLVKANVAIEGRPPKQPNFLAQLLLQLAPVLLLILVLVYILGRAQPASIGSAGKARALLAASAIGLPDDPGALRASGSLITVTQENGRPLLIELQALMNPAQSGAPLRNAQGLDAGRTAMLLAVLSRHARLGLEDRDVFVNTVGGINIRDTAIDLPLVLALAGSRTEQALPARLLAFGEIDLTGEVRAVAYGEERLKEAHRRGFRIAVVPRGNASRVPRGLTVIPVSRVEEAIQAAFATRAAGGSLPAP
jgi:hypothetical protein